MKKRTVIGILVLALILILALGGGAIAANGVMETEEGIIVDGVYAGSINLSGLTASEAEKVIQDYIDELESKSITMVTGKHKDTLKLSSIGIEWKNPEILEEAMELGKSGNLIARFKALSDLKRENHVYELNLEMNQTAIKNYVEKTLKVYDQEAKEPDLKRVNGEFVVTEEEEGLVVDEEATIASINKLLTEEWSSEEAEVETTVVVEKPEHTADELKKIKDVLGSRTTTYATSNRGRTQSLELSTSRLDGTIVWPGETISVSLLMGERSQEGGYGTGQGYFGTNVEETVGAGICQTASTLYNAALYAELDIVERYPHTLIVHYVDYGMDSTIYAGSDYRNPQKDLKLKNPYDDPIYIYASAGGGYCTFRIYGNETRPENREVKYIAKTLSETYPTGVTYTDDPTQPVGYEKTTQEAYPAVKATLTKEVYVDGKLTESTLLHTDSYSGANRKAIRGTKQPEATTQPSTTQPSTQTPGSTTTAPSESSDAGSSSSSEDTPSSDSAPSEDTPAPSEDTPEPGDNPPAESSPAE